METELISPFAADPAEITPDPAIQALIESVLAGKVSDPAVIEKVRAILFERGYALEPEDSVDGEVVVEEVEVIPTLVKTRRWMMDANKDGDVDSAEMRVFGLGVLTGWLASRLLR
jgi:hypothetical protein